MEVTYRIRDIGALDERLAEYDPPGPFVLRFVFAQEALETSHEVIVYSHICGEYDGEQEFPEPLTCIVAWVMKKVSKVKSVASVWSVHDM